ncbi:hypothetical protein ACWKSP_22185 [Micromonosporaceae bacterium Da 78-11]
MIKRAVRPNSGFLLIRNDVVRDRRLSYRARGLLCAMLSYPDNWQFNRDWLAGQSEQEGQHAVRTALQELERYGYLKRERRKDPETGKFGWEHVLYDTPQSAEGVFAGRSTGRESTGGEPPAGFRPSKEQLERTTEEEDEVECDHSGRFAPSMAALTNEDRETCEPTAHVPVQRGSEGYESDWRDEDRDLFADLVGAKLRLVGGRWNKGEWNSKAFYDAYRKPQAGRRRTLEWPGLYLRGVASNRDESAIEDWLISEGLERVD